jgi:hypothetical protein
MHFNPSIYLNYSNTTPESVHLRAGATAGFGATGFVGIDNDRKMVVVSLRGSVSVQNWVTDVKFARVPSPRKASKPPHVCSGQCPITALFLHVAGVDSKVRPRASLLITTAAAILPTYMNLPVGGISVFN